MRVVAPPAPGIAKIDEILLPTLDQREPSASDTVVRTVLPSRHEEAKTAAESAFVDENSAKLIRATKMNAARNRLFVDFLFVVKRARHLIRSGEKNSILPISRSSLRKRGPSD